MPEYRTEDRLVTTSRLSFGLVVFAVAVAVVVLL